MARFSSAQAGLQARVLLPALVHARQRQLVTSAEEAELSATIKAGTVKAGEVIEQCDVKTRRG